LPIAYEDEVEGSGDPPDPNKGPIHPAVKGPGCRLRNGGTGLLGMATPPGRRRASFSTNCYNHLPVIKKERNGMRIE